MAQRPRTRAATKAKRSPTGKQKPEADTRKTPVKPASPTRPTKRGAASAKPTPTERKAAKGDEAKRKGKPERDVLAKAKDRPTTRVAKSAGRKTAKTLEPVALETSTTAKPRKPRAGGTRTPEKKRAPLARGASTPSTSRASNRAGKSAKANGARKVPAYLAAELGQPVDHEGEPIGAGSARVRDDAELQEYALQLWRQMQSGGVVKHYLRAIERAGLTVDEVWTVGLGEVRSTSSTPDEMRRYKQRLLFRANLLEALLTETIADLHRLEGVEPTPAPPTASAWPPSPTASA